MSYRRLLGAPLVAAAVLYALAAPASAGAAGTYVDHECRTPSNAAGPSAGFTMKKDGNGDLGNSCGSDTGLLWVGFTGAGPWHSTDAATQTFTAPEGTTIAGFDIVRRSRGLAAAAPSPVAYRVSVDRTVLEGCGRLGQGACQDFDGTLSQAGQAATSVQIEIGCAGTPNDECTSPSEDQSPRVEISRAMFTLADTAAPKITAVRGLLAEPGNVAGRAGLEFDASDEGGGLYKLYVTIDGTLVETRGLDQGTGTCVDTIAGNDVSDFVAKQPCPTELKNVPVVVDTEALPNGVHRIEVTIEDAAGNRATVFAPAAGFQVLNQQPNPREGADPNAKLTMYFVKARGKNRRRLTSLKGERVVTRGRLIDSRGRGIRGAEIDVYHLVRGKPQLLKTGLKSRRQGRVTLILPNNVYGDNRGRRTLIYEYKAFRPADTPTSRQTLRLTVRDERGRPVTGPRVRRR